MEYLKSLFRDKESFIFDGYSYLPSSITVNQFIDLDVVSDVTVKFFRLEKNKEVILGFTGDPATVSRTIQTLREG